jgi:hypothetical protein
VKKRKKKKKKKKKREKKRKKAKKKRWQARPFGGVIKKPGWWPGKKGRRQLTARPGASCPCKVGEKE